jgi:hypothetical protein
LSAPLASRIELDIANVVGQDLAMSPKIPQIPPKSSRRIEVLAFPDVQMLDVAGPIQVFTAANERATSPHARLSYETRVIAPEGAEIRHVGTGVRDRAAARPD